jgi:hypothetical protein
MSYLRQTVRTDERSLTRHEKYDDAILRLLATASQPVDVERIRVECNIGNWQTALKHCLELLYEDKIRGIKTSKSWIFWTDSPDQPQDKFQNRRAK